jgi:hypothetical protein
MRQFLKSLFVGKRYIFVVSRGGSINTTELKLAYPNAVILTTDGDPNKSFAFQEV